jgi:GDP-mannose transporter
MFSIIAFTVLSSCLAATAADKHSADCPLGTCADSSTLLQTRELLSVQHAQADHTESGSRRLHEWEENLYAAAVSKTKRFWQAGLEALRTPGQPGHPPVKWHHDGIAALVYCSMNAAAFTIGIPLARWRGLSWHSIFAIVLFFVVNPLLLLCNKVAVMMVPLPGVIMWLQFAFAAVVLHMFTLQLPALSFCEVEPLEKSKIVTFGLTASLMAVLMLVSLRILQDVPIEAMICLKACLPLVFILPEYFIFNIDLPSKRSFACLIGCALCMMGYYFTESHQIDLFVYTLILVWFAFVVFDGLAIKYVMNLTPMSNWTRSYYQNALGLVPLTFFALREWNDAKQLIPQISAAAGAIIFLSCVLGLAMSFSGYLARDAFSPLGFVLVGNSCKWLAILTNAFMWNQHASPVGIACVCLSLLFCVGYEQSATKNTKS